MFTPKAIGFVRSPYRESAEIPKGLGARHDAVGALEILDDFEPGLKDIEGFSHLFVLWAFDRSKGFELTGPTPIDNKVHGVFATRSPRRPNPDWRESRRAAFPADPGYSDRSAATPRWRCR